MKFIVGFTRQAFFLHHSHVPQSVLRFLYIKELRATLSVHKEIEHTMVILKTSFYTTLQSKISEAWK